MTKAIACLRHARALAYAALATAMLAGCAGVPLNEPAAAPVAPGPQPDVGSAGSTPAIAVAEAAAVVASAAAPATPPSDEPPAAVVVDDSTPTGRADLPDDDAVRMDLWARVRAGYALTDLNGDLVRKWEQWYSSRPDYVERMTTRGGRYLFYIVEEVSRRGMPMELALLPFAESAYNPQAQSVAAASGIWQFMPGTGRDFELTQNLFRDDRRNVVASTQAALDYLQRLHDMFNDWQLALAAYNWGPGNVQKAVQRNLKAGLPADYDNLRMPDETRNYLPKLQAVKNIITTPDQFGLVLPPLQNHPSFLTVAIERDMDVALAARLADMTLEDFQSLNPQMNKPVILAAGTPQILLPYDAANHFLHALAQHRGPLASWTAWVAPRTIKPAEAARLVGMSEVELREVNRIPPKMLVKAGSTLLVPRTASHDQDVPGTLADNARMALAPDAPPLRKVSVKAGHKGETVDAIARRYRVSASQVAQWNGVSTRAAFRPGQTVVLMLASVPVQAAAAQRAAAATGAARTASKEAGKAAPAVKRRAAAAKPAAQPRVRVASR